MPINKKSIAVHQNGAVSQHVAEQVWAIKIKGVAIQ